MKPVTPRNDMFYLLGFARANPTATQIKAGPRAGVLVAREGCRRGGQGGDGGGELGRPDRSGGGHSRHPHGLWGRRQGRKHDLHHH